MDSNGELSGFVKIFYNLLSNVTVHGGLLAIVASLVVAGGFFDDAIAQILAKVLQNILGQM